MILSKKNTNDVIRPTKTIFGEEWFVEPRNFNKEFFGVRLEKLSKRIQPFPSLDAAMTFATNPSHRHLGPVHVYGPDGNVIESLV